MNSTPDPNLTCLGKKMAYSRAFLAPNWVFHFQTDFVPHPNCQQVDLDRKTSHFVNNLAALMNKVIRQL